MRFRSASPSSPVRHENASSVGLAVAALAMPLLVCPSAVATAISSRSGISRGTKLGAVIIVLPIYPVAFLAAARVFRLPSQSLLRVLSGLVGICSDHGGR